VGVHGFRHTNHAAQGEKAQEFCAGRDPNEVTRELRSGRDRLISIFGAKCLPIFVPPWNRISSEAAMRLRDTGYRALSTFGRDRVLAPGTGVAEINTHVDAIDWRGTRGGRDPVWLAAELAKQLALARNAGGTPVGVLTHHLVHDEIAWHFLEALFAETARHANVRWVGARSLIP
jgi:predicted deacetylase